MEHCAIDRLQDFYCLTHKRHTNECRGVLEQEVISAAREVVTEAQDLATHRYLRESLDALDALYELYHVAPDPDAANDFRRENPKEQ